MSTNIMVAVSREDSRLQAVECAFSNPSPNDGCYTWMITMSGGTGAISGISLYKFGTRKTC